MKQSFISISACLALALATGCKTFSVSSDQSLTNTLYPPTNPATVEILHAPPTRPHIRPGEVTAEPSSDGVSADKIEAALRKAASKTRGDAPVIVYDQTRITGAYVTATWYDRSVQ